MLKQECDYFWKPYAHFKFDANYIFKKKLGPGRETKMTGKIK